MRDEAQPEGPHKYLSWPVGFGRGKLHRLFLSGRTPKECLACFTSRQLLSLHEAIAGHLQVSTSLGIASHKKSTLIEGGVTVQGLPMPYQTFRSCSLTRVHPSLSESSAHGHGRWEVSTHIARRSQPQPAANEWLISPRCHFATSELSMHECYRLMSPHHSTRPSSSSDSRLSENTLVSEHSGTWRRNRSWRDPRRVDSIV